ncbi:PGF-pre-PGF domain-containing protein [Methanosarcina hadiensis]|uniref:PGF-pre-PGF domain-containing protein n=1 Tax=Methanosarcina hadiensis TaxID=3078083 RepID=UPI003977265A
MRRMKRELSILFTLIFAFQVFVSSAAATTFYVDDDRPGNYTTIQAALVDAVDGDTIIVNPGTYPEDVVDVNKPVTIKGASGYPSIGGFRILAQSNIQALTITKGVNFVDGGGSSTIRNNRFNGCGINIGTNYALGDQTIMNNLFSGSPEGVSTYDSINNKITGNTFQDCGTGLSLHSGGGGHVVTGNTFKNCDIGLTIFEDSASVYNNHFNNNINLEVRDDARVYLNSTKTAGNNIIGGPYIGGNFWASPAGDGFSQTHLDTNGDGFAEDAYQINERAIDYLPLATPGKEPGPVLPVANFRTSETLGNAPLSVTFTDLSQNATSWSWDFDNNGQSDSTARSPVYVYENPGSYVANLTVSNANGTNSKTAMITVLEKVILIFPTADFSASTTSGSPPLSVLFTDLSRNATSRSWDVNSDGIEDSKEESFVYVYTAAGTYTANLTVSNANGTDSKTITIDVGRKSSGGSSGGGGGGGGSPEPAKNVEVKELSQVFITNGKAVKFDFTKNATCVVYVGFDAVKNAGKTTTIVEQLKGKSAIVSELPEGEVYKSFNVWVGNSGYATSKNIKNPVVCFKVEKSWVQEKDIIEDSIALKRYSDKKWEQLSVNPAGEDDKYLYFTAGVPGYASFAVTGETTGIAGNISGEESGLETRALQEGGNETAGLNPGSDMGLDSIRGKNTKFPDISPFYGAIGIILLSFICIFIYRNLPK